MQSLIDCNNSTLSQIKYINSMQSYTAYTQLNAEFDCRLAKVIRTAI